MSEATRMPFATAMNETSLFTKKLFFCDDTFSTSRLRFVQKGLRPEAPRARAYRTHQLIDTGLRRRMIDAMRSYDRTGKRYWRAFFKENDPASAQKPAA